MTFLLSLLSFGIVLLASTPTTTNAVQLPPKQQSVLSLQDTQILLVATGGENWDKNTTATKNNLSSARRRRLWADAGATALASSPPRHSLKLKSHQALPTVERFSLSNNQHLPNGANFSLHYTGFGSTAVTFNSTTVIYVAGGWGSDGNGNDDDEPNKLTNFSSYDVLNDQWRYDLPSLPQQVSNNALVLVNTTLFALGGEDLDNWPVRAVYAIDIPSLNDNTSVWRTLDAQTPLGSGLTVTCVVAVQNSIFILDRQMLFESSDGAQSWQEKKPKNGTTKPTRIISSSCAAVGDDAFISVGNVAGDSTYHAYLYNLTTNTWLKLPNMNVGRYAAGVAAMPPPDNEKVLVCGGFGAKFRDDANNSCEMYNFTNSTANATWTMTNFTLSENRGDFGFYLLTVNNSTAQ